MAHDWGAHLSLYYAEDHADARGPRRARLDARRRGDRALDKRRGKRIGRRPARAPGHWRHEDAGVRGGVYLSPSTSTLLSLRYGWRELLFIPPYTLANAFAFVLNMVGLRILACNR